MDQQHKPSRGMIGLIKKMKENPSLKNNVVGLTSAEEHQQFLAAERVNKGFTPGSQTGGRYDSNRTSSGGGSRQSQHPPDNYRLYVGNCPMGIQSGTLSSFFSEAMMNANLTTTREPDSAVQRYQ